MPFDFASAKANARRVVHATLAVDALYTDASVSDADPVDIKARWHNKLELFGDPNNEGYTQMIQGIDRIVLFPGDNPEIEYKRGDIIEFPCFEKTFTIDVLESADGPLKRVWQAVEKKT